MMNLCLRRASPLLASFLALGAGSSWTQAAPPGDAAQIRQAYQRMARYTAAHDIPGIATLLAPDFSYWEPDGRHTTRAGYLHSVRDQLHRTRRIDKQQTTVQRITIHSGAAKATATAIVQVHVVADILDNRGVSHKRDVTRILEDTWTGTGGAWKRSRGKVLRYIERRDGAPFNPYAPAKPRGRVGRPPIFLNTRS